jgi:hypothetical protein
MSGAPSLSYTGIPLQEIHLCGMIDDWEAAGIDAEPSRGQGHVTQPLPRATAQIAHCELVGSTPSVPRSRRHEYAGVAEPGPAPGALRDHW